MHTILPHLLRRTVQVAVVGCGGTGSAVNLGGVPESTSNLSERWRRSLCAGVLNRTAHRFFFPQNLLPALCANSAAQFAESLPDASRALVPQLGRDFVDRWRTVLGQVSVQNGFEVSPLGSCV